jgi:ribosome recycling factor
MSVEESGMDEVMLSCDKDMQKRVELLDRDLGKVRTGRASVTLLDGIKVNYYGNLTPLSQVASLSTPDARSILVSPFEKKALSDIERAIQMADVGIQPNNDGNVIRLPVPPLTEERRKDLAKGVKKIAEEAKVVIRQVRQDYNAKLKKMEKDKKISEDDSKRLQKDVQTVTDKYNKLIDDKAAKKEKDILTL